MVLPISGSRAHPRISFEFLVLSFEFPPTQIRDAPTMSFRPSERSERVEESMGRLLENRCLQLLTDFSTRPSTSLEMTGLGSCRCQLPLTLSLIQPQPRSLTADLF